MTRIDTGNDVQDSQGRDNTTWYLDEMELSRFEDRVTMSNKLMRGLWNLVWVFLFLPSPVVCRGWRRFLLRVFGARLAPTANIYPSVHIWAPWNLVMGEFSCLARNVNCYSVARITLGDGALVSQGAHLCAATHDYRVASFPLVATPITIGARAWVAAEAFIGPGVEVGPAAIIGARACVVKDVAANAIVVGNPARVVKTRGPNEMPA